MEDEIVFNYKPIINASKSKSYKDSVNKNCTALMNFLVKNNLILINPLNDNGIIKQDLKIFKRDLSDDGFILFQGPIYKWFNYLDRGGNCNNVSLLEKEIHKKK